MLDDMQIRKRSKETQPCRRNFVERPEQSMEPTSSVRPLRRLAFRPNSVWRLAPGASASGSATA